MLLLLLHLLHGASTGQVHRREEELGRVVRLASHSVRAHATIWSHEERRRASIVLAVVELASVLLDVRRRLEVGRQTLEVRRRRIGCLSWLLHVHPLRVQRLTWPEWGRVGVRRRDGSQQRRARGRLHHRG